MGGKREPRAMILGLGSNMNRNNSKSSSARGRRTAFRARSAALVLLAMTVLAGACNLVVEGATDQCSSDADCSKFGNGSVCQQGLCVAKSSASSGTGGGGGGESCFSGTPTKDEDYLNTCTNATCVEFDNCARLGLCDGAALPPLVAPPAP